VLPSAVVQPTQFVLQPDAHPAGNSRQSSASQDPDLNRGLDLPCHLMRFLLMVVIMVMRVVVVSSCWGSGV